MKKLIIAAFILLASTVTYAGPIITLSIEFGHLDANKVCVERGLCKISIGGSRAMTASINDNTGNLEMVFIKNASSQFIYDAQFINGLFEVPISYALSNDVCSKLGIDKFIIKSGKYKVVETNTQYKIVFTK